MPGDKSKFFEHTRLTNVLEASVKNLSVLKAFELLELCLLSLEKQIRRVRGL